MLPPVIQQWDYSTVNALSTYTATHFAVSVIIYFCAQILIVVPFATLLLLWVSPDRFTKTKAARKTVIMTIVALTVALAIKALLDFFVARERPFVAHPDLLRLPLQVDSSSFPSGHALLAFTVAFSFFWSKFYRTGSLMLFIACVISVARVAAGVHYPTDIIGGMLFALFSVWLVHHEASGVRAYLPNQ